MAGEGIMKCSFAGRDEIKIRGKDQAKNHKFPVFNYLRQRRIKGWRFCTHQPLVSFVIFCSDCLEKTEGNEGNQASEFKQKETKETKFQSLCSLRYLLFKFLLNRPDS